MPLFFHESIHLILSLLSGYLVWLISGNSLTFVFGLLGGFFIDLDHLIDYLLAFGFKFNLAYFLKGYSFLKTDKIYVLFHSWELIIFLLLITFKLSNLNTLQPLLLSFSLSFLFHLIVDVFINNMNARSYFLYYRIKNKFELKSLVTHDHYQKHLKQKRQIV